MTPLIIPYPQIDPVLVQLGPFAIRWYALAYIAGLVIGWRIMRRVCEQPPKLLTPAKIDDFLLWAALGVILGGRLGYVLFYKPVYFLQNPLQILTLWEGGMSFHGGLLGVILAILLFALRNGVSPFMLSDLVAIVAPIGLFFGRLANFVNGELWGRITDVPWAMIFPRGGPVPRHPSQLYEAGLEGLVLFIILQVCLRVFRLNEKPGLLSAIFFLGYGTFRFVCEFFREPDTQFVGPISMGMALSIPVWLAAGILFWLALRKPRAA